jgi:aldose sugar dehydrogenase
MTRRSEAILYMAALCLAAILISSITTAQAAPVAQSIVDGREALPPGVATETVLAGMNRPVAMAFDPQGRLFYTEKDTGNVRLFANGALRPDPVMGFKVDNQGERGLLGIAVDPSFNQNHYIYVYYTCLVGADCASSENRVVRFVENNGAGSNPTTIFSSSATAPQSQHNGGNIHFGPDGKLYISIGDDAIPNNAQDVTNKHGKLHRINPDGSMPSDNPGFNTPGALPSLYARGLRNSFDFTFDPVVPGRIFATENGRGCDDEMNRIEAGFNYGWRENYPCEGEGPDPTYNTIAPLWTTSYRCCPVPTGIAVYTGEQIPEWRNHLFMATYQEPRRLYHFYLNAGRTAITAANVVPAVIANMDIETGPDGALWYIQGGGYTDGTLMRLVKSSGPAEPTPTSVSGSATATSVPNPAATPASTPPALPGTGSRTFAETGKSVTGIFLTYWDTHGGLAQQGFPISDLMVEISDLNGKTYAVQYFERAVFEYHPENQPPYDVLLSQLGIFQYEQKYPDGAPGQQANNDAGSMLFPETGKRVGGRFLRYWQEHGGLMQQGFPISDEFTEKSDLDGNAYQVQYFERAVFEYHPENQAPYDVLLSQLGTTRYKEKYGSR